MASSLFGQNPQNQMPQNNLIGMIQQFNQFKNSLSGQDPRAIVQGMIQSGRMSQDQFNQLAQMANQLGQFLK